MPRPRPGAWPGFSPRGSLLLPLRATDVLDAGMPARLDLDGQALALKHEFHATLLDRDTATRLRRQLGDARMRTLYRALDWTTRATGRHALIHRPASDCKSEAWSVIAHLALPALAAFRQALGDAAGIVLDPGIPHATLYVAGDPDGIGLPDQATWRARHVRDLGPADLRPPP
jgi:hypothetical protein